MGLKRYMEKEEEEETEKKQREEEDIFPIWACWWTLKRELGACNGNQGGRGGA